MPNFSAAPTVDATCALRVWTDPATLSEPSRLNASPANPHRYYECVVGVGPVEVKAIVDGTSGPLDVDLGGELFTSSFVEWPPGTPPPSITLTAGQTSVAEFTFAYAGLYLLMLRRTNGGGFGVHFYVIEAE